MTGGIGRQLRAVALSPFVSQRLTMFLATVNHTLLERLAEFIADGRVTPMIGQRCALGDVPEAMRQLAAGQAVGKTVINVRPVDRSERQAGNP